MCLGVGFRVVVTVRQSATITSLALGRLQREKSAAGKRLYLANIVPRDSMMINTG
ncbi:hypothetical protein P692DRAFT_201794968 [Suillus brevipes Sb2]|nr:hypothetical protein P692DRAFT_201794968 [Suillus brevipes Sb2]